MAVEYPVLDVTFTAGEDLSAVRYSPVALNADGNVVACAAGADAIGFLQNKPGNGEAAVVRVAGITKAVANGAISVGSKVDAAGAGKVRAQAGTHTTDTTTGDVTASFNILGVALEAAAADNDVITVLIARHFQ